MTETQPDPQVESTDDPRRDALRCTQCEYRADNSPGGWFDASLHRDRTGHRYEHVRPAPKPLTVADIPAGLFLKDDGRGYVDLYEKGADGGVAKILDLDEVSATLAQHLAATLPTVTEDAP